MRLSETSLEALRDLINEKIVYRSGPQLIAFFAPFFPDRHDSYGPDFGSRKDYTLKNLLVLNGTADLDVCVARALAVEFFAGDDAGRRKMIADLNQRLLDDGVKIEQSGSNIVVVGTDDSDSEDRREEVLKELYPFGTPPSLDDVLMDIHLDKEFAVRDFKVIEQNGYVMLVSPYFAVDGASVVDWQPKNAAEDGTFISKMADEQIEKAFSAGRADGFTGMPKGTAKPTRAEGMSTERFRAIESVYDEGYEVGRAEREQQQNPSFFTSNASRRTGRRPR